MYVLDPLYKVFIWLKKLKFHGDKQTCIDKVEEI